MVIYAMRYFQSEEFQSKATFLFAESSSIEWCPAEPKLGEIKYGDLRRQLDAQTVSILCKNSPNSQLKVQDLDNRVWKKENIQPILLNVLGQTGKKSEFEIFHDEQILACRLNNLPIGCGTLAPLVLKFIKD